MTLFSSVCYYCYYWIEDGLLVGDLFPHDKLSLHFLYLDLFLTARKVPSSRSAGFLSFVLN